MKDTPFIIIIASGITTSLLLLTIIISTGWFLYGVKIRTSPLEAGKFIIGDPIINKSSYEINYADPKLRWAARIQRLFGRSLK